MKFVCKVPVLQGLKAFPFLHVEASENSVTFTAYTGESHETCDYFYASNTARNVSHPVYVYVQVKVAAVVSEAGSASFQSKIWKPFARKTVTVSTDPASPQTASIAFGAAVQVVGVLTDAIKMPSENAEPLFPLTLDLSASEAISEDETRPHLSCLHLHAKNGYLQATATDGHRLHRTSAPFEGTDFEMTVPRLAVEALALVKGLDAMCAPGMIRKGAMTVRFPPFLLAFPPCDRIIPQGMDRTTILPVKDLRTLLKNYPKAYEIGGERSDLSRDNLVLTISEGSMKIARDGYFERSVAAETKGLQPGETFKIGVFLGYLFEALELVSEGASMGSSGDLDPLLITWGERRAVVMPCRV